MVKYASNAFLAARISFINEIARISERVGADAKLVAEGMGMDKRIGPSFLDAGIGYGGSCFPKDVKALTALAERFDYHPELLQAVMDINRDQRMVVIDKLRDCLDELPDQIIGCLASPSNRTPTIFAKLRAWTLQRCCWPPARTCAHTTRRRWRVRVACSPTSST